MPAWPPSQRHAPAPTCSFSARPVRRPRRAGSAAARPAASGTRSRPRLRAPGRSRLRPVPPTAPVALCEVSTEGARPLPTGVGELDRVLGGGVVAGSVTLLFGPPGHRQVHPPLPGALASVAAAGVEVLLASAEESLTQVSGRAGRHRARCRRTCWPSRGPTSRRSRRPSCSHRPALVVVDSIQTVADPALAAARGQPGPGAARCVDRLTRLAKSTRGAARPGRPRDQGRRPGRPAGGRAPGRHRPLLRRRPPPRAARAHRRQAPVRPRRRGGHLRDARRRPARGARPRAAAAGRPHGRGPGQRRGPRPAGPAARCWSRCRPCSARQRRRAARPRTLGIDPARANLLLAVLACRTRGRGPGAAEFFVAAVGGIASPSRPPTWPSPWPWPRRPTGVAGPVRPGRLRRARPGRRGPHGARGRPPPGRGAARRVHRALVPASLAHAAASVAPPAWPSTACARWRKRWSRRPGGPERRARRVRCPCGRRSRRQPAAERRAGPDRARAPPCARASTASCRPSTAR